ncbi:DEAD/DEAH box helicase [Clostridium drakei]|uniref:ATP-dependent RNA helicase DbpA n=1 Tax=Clostridium drakei TaxID=332101 RepID=A0A2U8DQT5_9CLOT|nr:DEAD/DEAH box helicase [Clostridium drakei]AWI05137.1 RNA helicase [Clostridium drakei]
MSEIKFEDFRLGQDILKSIKNIGYKKPSKVQQQVIPLILKGKDVIVKSQTGSGKTAAFAIPICEHMEIEENEAQALILTPTRELAVQIKEDISNIGRFKRIRCAAIFGKQPMDTQKKELKQRVHIIVGTPGRTLDHIKRGNMNLENIKFLILDEADEMLNMGFIEEVSEIIENIPVSRQNMLFSATMPEAIENLSKKYMKNPAKIEITPEKLTVDNIEQKCYIIEENNKFSLLRNLLYMENPDTAIVFCRTKNNVDYVTSRMKAEKYSCDKIHGGMLQNERLDTMNSFKRGEFRFLIATDVAARGIDIDNVTHVINYDLPMEKESYIHRIGRTGRAGNKGTAITFSTPNEDRFLSEIEDYIQMEIQKCELPTEKDANENKEAFLSKNKIKPLKKGKTADLNREITKIYINAGKKKKIRPGDIVGAISNSTGLSAEVIGVIDIHDTHSYIDILEGNGEKVLKALSEGTIKGKKVKVELASK